MRYKPYIGYRTAVNRHLIPGLGAHQIDRVQPEHFEKLYAGMARGLKPGTAHQVHRTARTAFGEAFKRGYIPGIPSPWPSRRVSKTQKSTPSRPRRSTAS